MVDELIYSPAWEKGKEEGIEVFTVRKDLQFEQLYQMRRNHGQCYMVRFGEEDIRPMWEDQINMKVLEQQILSPVGMPLDCPLCQPYDNFDKLHNSYTGRRYLTKIINPRYPEGVVDKGGVWAKCPCLCKGEDRERLKFKGMGVINE